MLYEGSLSALERQYRDWLSSAKTLLEAHDYRTAFRTYPFVRNEHAPWAPVAKPLHESLVALVSTGGFYVRGVQPAFDAANIEGDLSYRAFSRTVPPGQLGIAHDHFPHRYAEADLNTILPLDHMSDFEREGLIGECEDTIYSITGYLTNTAVFIQTTAQEIAQRLKDAQVDVALLIPVWPICHQSGGLIARAVESVGIPTMTIGSMKAPLLQVKPPRSIVTPFPRGATLGAPGDRAQQRQVLLDAFTALQTMTEPGSLLELPYKSFE